ncbi:hypothetical protein [Kitasatospora sp. MBT63]|uniref:hypothetical protein n=1 Tax=Kitasatospora sp. MBT63 TaxID=1444768 RepID=UPI000B30A135|nr:hypothetical protein [Kitasatospora sp. MBT63]
MGDVMWVRPDELAASARVADALAEEFRAPAEGAIAASRAAAAPLAAWSVGGALERMADGWAPALDGLRQRFCETAANLDRAARQHRGTDRAVAGEFLRAGR